MKLSFFILAFLLIAPNYTTANTSTGIVTGGVIYELPRWFKSSFLDFSDEIDEAKIQGKHVMAFMHLDECPYCHRMLQENFIEGESRNFMQENFEVIGVNVRGDLDVTWIDGNSYTERELTEHLNAIATPTIVFLDLDGNKVLQLNGYRDPRSFHYALNYVEAKHYYNESFSDYLAKLEKPDVYELRSHRLLKRVTYFKGYSKPLMILFEDGQCAECDRYHENTLNHRDVLSAMEGYLFVRLDADSSQNIVDLHGRVTTPKQWSKDLNLTFRPALVLFNSGKELFRAEGIQYHHHLSEGLEFSKSGYLEYGTLREFKTSYREDLIKSGGNVDFSE
ncbi:MAG: thioredoxin-related protein [Parasphingorhabdus sp.]|jgi:thioredoxin-related protein